MGIEHLAQHQQRGDEAVVGLCPLGLEIDLLLLLRRQQLALANRLQVEPDEIEVFLKAWQSASEADLPKSSG